MAAKMERRDFKRVRETGGIPESAACKILGKSQTTMKRWRREGGGPPFTVVHARLICYDRAALLDWQKTHGSKVAA